MAQLHLPPGRGGYLFATCIVLSLLSTVTFALRVYVHLKWIKRGSAEIWLAAVGWALFMAFCAIAILGSYSGTGQHIVQIPWKDIPFAFELWYICEVLYVPSNTAVKLSIALMLLRYTVEESHKKFIYIVTVVNLIIHMVFFGMFVCQCMPVTFFWTKYAGGVKGQCMPLKVMIIAVYTSSTISIIFDWTFALLPWPIVRKLHLDLRTRLMVACVLALGSIASIATIIRIPYLSVLWRPNDFLYEGVDIAVWTTVETGLSIVASSAATLRPLFKKRPMHHRQQMPRLASISITLAGSSTSKASKQTSSTVMSERTLEDGIQ